MEEQTSESSEESKAESSEDRPVDSEAEGTASGSEADDDALFTLKAERDKLYQQLLRAAADLDNLRKRSRKEVEDAAKRAAKLILLEVLPIIDNLERAVQASEAALDAKAVADGVRMVLKQFDDVAGRIALERVQSVGERFDPNIHDAVQQKETDEHPPGAIVAEVVPGYMRLGELIRPAMVVVARKPTGTDSTAPAADPDSDEEDENG